MGDLDGKVALVVGAGPGVGRACAHAFAAAGADVVVAARRVEPLEALAREVAETSGRSTAAIPADLGDLASCEALIDATTTRFGGVDAIVNVATIGGGTAIDRADLDGWRQAFEVNVLGTLEVSRCAARSMVTRGGGSIVQISTHGTHSLPPRLAAYTATKQAMVTASLTMAKELGRHNVRVNIVTPGYITGPDLDMIVGGIAARTGEAASAVSERLASTGALRRHVDPVDIAEATVFLSSERARNITGVEISVTAGQQL